MQVKKENGKWRVRFRCNGEHVRRVLKASTKKKAQREAQRLYSRAIDGLPIDEDPSEGAPTVISALAEYEDHLKRKGSSAMHVYHSISYMTRAAFDADAKTMADLDTPALERALGFLQDRSSRTQNKVIGYFKAWFRWLEKTGRWSRNSAAALERVKDRAALIERRQYSDLELKALTTSELIPEARQILYLVAAHTGLRRSELDSLRWGDVDLDSAEVTIRAEHAKNNKTVTLPIPRDTARRWREWVASGAITYLGHDPVEWPDPLPPPPQPRTLYEDFFWLGIERETPAGRLDFHSFRVTYGSLLARRGVPLVLAQKLMRHSTPQLTANLYTRFQPEDRRAAVESLVAPRPGHGNGHRENPKHQKRRIS